MPWSRNHSTWWSSRTARTQRRTVEAGHPSCAAIRRYRSRVCWPAALYRSPRWCRLGAIAPPQTAARGWNHRICTELVEAAASASSIPSHGHRGPARVPTGAAGRRIPGRPVRPRPSPPRPASGPRSRSSRCRPGTAHERGLSRARVERACGPGRACPRAIWAPRALHVARRAGPACGQFRYPTPALQMANVYRNLFVEQGRRWPAETTP
jgi:hypothetical protein